MEYLPPSKKYTAPEVLSMIRQNSSEQWMSLQSESMLELFHAAAIRVPAYKDFLYKNAIDPTTIKTLTDLKSIPVTNKNNYLRQYSLANLCWDGTLDQPLVFAATSGSTGKPFYFPHDQELDWQYSILAELFLEQGIQTHKKGPTLVLVTFGMGVWIGGLFTYQAFELASLRGKNLSILTPGVNKGEILHALKDLAPNFAQTIIIGYPPFVKDVLDEALLGGISLHELNIRLVFAAEGFTEKFREHLMRMAGTKNPYLDTLNIYGTADIGAMAYETPTAILMRRLALADQKLFLKLFGPVEKTPTLAQYNPLFTNFEAHNGEILLTGYNTLPLIRYAVGDQGGVFSFDDAITCAKNLNTDVAKCAAEAEAPLYQLPFVYVYERADFSTKLYGAIMYPEHIREALQDEKLLQDITGKFNMHTRLDDNHDQYLELNVELRQNGTASEELTKSIKEVTTALLLEKNSEYRNNYASMGEKVTPRVVFWPHGDEKYFKTTIKQKWVIKD